MAEAAKSRRRELTRAELQIMQILWARGAAFVNDVLADLEEPKPAYNTVSTIIRILEKKGFVGHKAYGKTHEYHPLVTREEYARGFMAGVLDNFFGGSVSRLVSFFSDNHSISVEETDEILRLLNEKR